MNQTHLDQDIHIAKEEVLLLGSMVEQALLDSVQALKDQDLDKSRAIIENDQAINSRRYEIEFFTIATIATQQPAARDVRTLASILELAGELERIGDYAKGIATINLRFGGLGFSRLLGDLYQMSLTTADMLHRSLTAFMLEDTLLAESIIKEDLLIDSLYGQLNCQVLDCVTQDARNIERINHVLWVGHNLERVGDRVTNICKRVIFDVTGKLEKASTHNGVKPYRIQDA